MPSFEQEFIQSRGKPVEFRGGLVHMVDQIPVSHGEQLRLAFESSRTEWRQGVGLDLDGTIVIDGTPCGNKVAIWIDTAPRVVQITADLSTPTRRNKKRSALAAAPALSVKNLWDTGDGTIHAWHHGAAMIIEEIPGGRRYRCNDGHPDDNFDDIVFRIERHA